MLIYFVRHASAGQRKSDPKRDDKRALDQEGILQCTYVGRALAAMNVQVEVIVSSPLKRATQTASLVGNEINHLGKLDLSPALRPDVQYSEFRKLLDAHAGREAIMVVGHNPSLTEFLGRLISEGNGEAVIELKKGAVAKVEMQHGTGVLQWCLTPKVLRAIYESAVTSSRPKTSRK